MEGWENMARELCSMPVLLWVALQDKKHLSISRMTLGIAVVVLLVAGCFCEVAWQGRIGGAAFGVLILVFCFFSKEALGVADGILILACGVAFGLYETVTVCFLATLFAGMFSMVILLAKKAGRKSRIPFLPFLLLGYVTMRILGNTI